MIVAQPIDYATWISGRDYPRQALSEARTGVTGFRLTVGKDGMPFRCEVTHSAGFGDLDRQTCDVLMRRGRFHPALDAEGQPIVAVYRNFNRWMIDGKSTPKAPSRSDIEVPTEELPPGVKGKVLIQVGFLVDADGAIADCAADLPAEIAVRSERKRQATANAMLGASACAQIISSFRAVPATDEDGRRVRSAQTARVMFAKIR